MLEAARIQRDVTYGEADGVALKMDLYFPKQPASKPMPALMYVHGGAWRTGDKAMGAGMMAVSELLKRGYLVTSINYRLAPKYKFPAQIEDTKCAVRYLRAHAKEYDLDPNRIGVWGGSAGGHLVALLGLADEKAGLEGKGGWADQSSRVQAVVDMFGPTDFVAIGEGNQRVGEDVFGVTSAEDPILKKASPVTYVRKDAPPFLILHGDKDRVVRLRHSEELNRKLNAVGASSELVVVKNAGHGFAPDGGEPDPNRMELAKRIGEFFDKNLKK